MVTVKEKVPVESGVPEHVQQRDFDSFEGPSATPRSLLVGIEQRLWWSHPGPVGPQERYESEFQVPPPYWFPPNNSLPKPEDRTVPPDQYQMQLKLLEQEDKKQRTPTQSEYSYAGREGHQMQLMLLEQQKKKRLVMARQEQCVMYSPRSLYTPETIQSGREQSMESTSTWTTQFTPESTPGFQDGREPSMGALNQIQLNFMERNLNGSDLRQGLSQASCTCASSGQILGDHDVAVKQEEDHTAASSLPERSLPHYQEQLMLNEQHNRTKWEARDGALISPPTYPGHHSLQDYQMALMLWKHQNKKRKMLESEEELRGKQAMETRKVEKKLRRLETQNKGRLMMAGKGKQPQVSTSAQPSARWVQGGEAESYEEEQRQESGHQSTHLCDDGELQLISLEQQNKKQLMMQKAGLLSQESTSAGPSTQRAQSEKQVMIGGSAWITPENRDLHKKPLVIRERPTCDD